MPHSTEAKYTLQGLNGSPNISLSSFHRALVLVPHPDDEAIGCGGLISALVKEGCDVFTLLVSDGSGGPDAPFNASNVRLDEFQRSIEILGAQELNRLMLEDSNLVTHKIVLREQIKKHILQCSPDLIIAPWLGDSHPDHSVIGVCASDLSKELDLSLIAYEVWTPLKPTHALDITPVSKKKREAIQAHKTALRFGNYVNASMGLAQYRSLLLPFQNNLDVYAEVFQIRI
jgi:LmbE family N-acetylglucosaminyl deacetylase